MKTPAAMIMGGPMFGRNETELGAMVANELMLTLIVASLDHVHSHRRFGIPAPTRKAARRNW